MQRREFIAISKHLKKLASMLHREHVCIEIGNPLLALLRHAKVAQGISDIRPDRLPEEIWVIISQIGDAIVIQFIDHSRLAKLVKKGRLLSQVVDVRELPDQIRCTYQALASAAPNSI